MKKLPKLLIASALVVGVGALIAADHLDAPAVGGTTADITDFFAFESAENEDNTVFVVNVQSSLAPAGNDATFDESILVEVNIDNVGGETGDLVEDLVIQAIARDGIMYFFGPYAPGSTGLNSEINVDEMVGSVEITTDGSPIVATNDAGMKFYAGPREDPFYFDFTTFNAVIAGDAENNGPNGGFQTAENAVDTFDGTNVLSIVVEVPNSTIGATVNHPAGFDVQVWNTWAEAKRKQ